MPISTVTSSSYQVANTTLNRAAEIAEGNGPDNDGDKDDALNLNSTSTVQNVSTSSATGNIGSNINVYA